MQAASLAWHDVLCDGDDDDVFAGRDGKEHTGNTCDLMAASACSLPFLSSVTHTHTHTGTMLIGLENM